MKYTFLNIAFLLLVSMKFISCKEKFECTADKTVAIPQVMKDYFYFKQGSWWVYVNVNDNTYDSMWVSQSSSNINRGEGKEGYGELDKCYEQTRSVIKNEMMAEVGSFSLANRVVNQKQQFKYKLSWTDMVTTANKDIEIYYTDNQFEKQNQLYPIFISIIDTIVFRNEKFTNLIEINTTNYSYDNLIYRLYSKNMGLIKYIDRDSNQWELIKYNLNQ